MRMLYLYFQRAPKSFLPISMDIQIEQSLPVLSHNYGTLKKYFLKCVTGDAGQIMVEGEYWAMTELFKTIPSAIAQPLARGRFQR